MYKLLIFLFLLFALGCDKQGNPIGVSDNAGTGTTKHIHITDFQNNYYDYSYTRIWYTDKTLNIDFSGGCGASIPIESITFFETIEQ